MKLGAPTSRSAHETLIKEQAKKSLKKKAETPRIPTWQTRGRFREDPWYSRGYIPHYNASEVIQFVTFRLYDSLPQQVISHLKESVKKLPENLQNIAYKHKIEKYIDNGYGACFLKDPRVAPIIEDSLLYYNHKRYVLHAWVIMPNHIHILCKILENHCLAEIVKSFKSYTARQANAILKRKGAFWYRDYFDRYIRDERHYMKTIEYILYNPVQAGLCEAPGDWSYGSARRVQINRADLEVGAPSGQAFFDGSRDN